MLLAQKKRLQDGEGWALWGAKLERTGTAGTGCPRWRKEGIQQWYCRPLTEKCLSNRPDRVF